MLSVCIITKNEKENLQRCLKQLVGYGFELVVVDTGSTDGTISMAREYTDALYEFEWCDDFARAKNFAVSKAKNDMVLVIDSDEYLCGIDQKELSKQLLKFPKAVGRIRRNNQIMQGGEQRESMEYINRIFDRRYFHYVGKIHEQLTSLDGTSYDTYRTSIVIDHSGYLLTEQKRIEKAERNIKLLKRELEETGNDPYLLYQLGKSYYMMGQYEDACVFFSESLSFDLDTELEYVIDMVDSYGYAMLNSGQTQAALGLEGIYETFGIRADFQFLMGLIYMNNERYDDAVSEFLKAAAQKESRVKGVNGYLSFYNAGVIYECLGNREKALEMYEKCGKYEPAMKRKRLTL